MVEADQFECVDVKQRHTADVKVLAWDPSGSQLLSGSYDTTIRAWEEGAEGAGDEWSQV